MVYFNITFYNLSYNPLYNPSKTMHRFKKCITNVLKTNHYFGPRFSVLLLLLLLY